MATLNIKRVQPIVPPTTQYQTVVTLTMSADEFESISEALLALAETPSDENMPDYLDDSFFAVVAELKKSPEQIAAQSS